MHCIHCGTPTLADAKFCTKCGALLCGEALKKTKENSAPNHETRVTPEAVSPVTGAPPALPQQSSNYLVRHWQGDLPLAQSFWINLLLLANGIAALLFLSVRSIEVELSVRAIALVLVIALTFTLVAWIWGVFGVWRSSEKHTSRGGLSVHAGIAKVMVVLGGIITAGQMGTVYLPMFQTFVPLIFGHDSMGEYQVTVLADGRSILVSGTLREGSAEGIEKIIKAAPAVTTLMLNSNGGRLGEGKRLAEFVYERGLNTYVEGACLSACTFVFLAGKDRAATPNGKIGFHLPVVPWNTSKADDGSDYMVNVYRRAGLPEAFIERVRATPASTMWYPTRDELIAARVITRVSLGGETGMALTGIRSKQELTLTMRNTPLWAAVEKRFPAIFSEAADRAWSAKESGGNDTQVFNAMRSSMIGLWATLRSKGDDAFLERMAILSVTQLTAARTVSYEACTKHVAGQLDITSTLPKVHTENELALVMEILASEPRPITRHKSALMARALEDAISRMPPHLVDVVANPERYTSKPELQCDASIALFEKALSLPPSLRAAALDGLLRQ